MYLSVHGADREEYFGVRIYRSLLVNLVHRIILPETDHRLPLTSVSGGISEYRRDCDTYIVLFFSYDVILAHVNRDLQV